MRGPGVLIGLLLFVGSSAQSSVPELGKASDAGRKVYKERIAGSGMGPRHIYRSTEVDQLPVYPGGTDSLLLALRITCDTAIVATALDCDSSFQFLVRFIVDVDGRATHQGVLGADSCPVLLDSTRCAVQRLQRFGPALKGGVPVRMRMEVQLRYDRS